MQAFTEEVYGLEKIDKSTWAACQVLLEPRLNQSLRKDDTTVEMTQTPGTQLGETHNPHPGFGFILDNGVRS